MAISPKQSPRMVERQLRHAEVKLAKKQEALRCATGKSQQTRLRLEIAEYERQIREYRAFLR